MAALLLLILSSAFDQKVFDIEYRIFFEELSEMSAYYMMIAAALLASGNFSTIDTAIKNNSMPIST